MSWRSSPSERVTLMQDNTATSHKEQGAAVVPTASEPKAAGDGLWFRMGSVQDGFSWSCNLKGQQRWGRGRPHCELLGRVQGRNLGSGICLECPEGRLLTVVCSIADQILGYWEESQCTGLGRRQGNFRDHSWLVKILSFKFHFHFKSQGVSVSLNCDSGVVKPNCQLMKSGITWEMGL